MASVSHLTKLFKAVAAGDFDATHLAAGEIVEAEEHLGHHLAAMQLRGSLRPNESGHKSTRSNTHTAQNTLLVDALTQISLHTGLDGVALRPAARHLLCEIKDEWVNQDRLQQAGLPRRKKLLFHGRPGCGKSLTAAALGFDLSLPVFVVRFDAVVGAYLGQTALNLRELFRFAENLPSVLLIDEVDALGKARGDPQDVGELHRVAIALLQELEHANPQGYVIATSNLPARLDSALWRRFDGVLEFPRPSKKELLGYATKRATKAGITLTKLNKQSVEVADSYADAERIVIDEARRRLLSKEIGSSRA